MNAGSRGASVVLFVMRVAPLALNGRYLKGSPELRGCPEHFLDAPHRPASRGWPPKPRAGPGRGAADFEGGSRLALLEGRRSRKRPPARARSGPTLRRDGEEATSPGWQR